MRPQVTLEMNILKKNEHRRYDFYQMSYQIRVVFRGTLRG